MPRHCKNCPKTISECDKCDECQKELSLSRGILVGLLVGILVGAGMIVLLSYIDDLVAIMIIEYCTINDCESVGEVSLKGNFVKTPIGWEMINEPDIVITLDGNK